MSENAVSKHTKLPWVGTMESPDFAPLIGANGENIFTYTIDDNGLHFKVEDVDFIIKACNNFYAMKDALEAWTRVNDKISLAHERALKEYALSLTAYALSKVQE